MQRTQQKTKVIYADILRAFAAVTTVILHTAGPVLYESKFYNSSWWWTGNIIDSASRWCVPVFIMISGMFALDSSKEEAAGDFLGKRLLKVGLPLIFWSLVYFYWKQRYRFIYSRDLYSQFFYFFKELLEGKTYYHLWFIYMIIGFYLLTPIYKVYVKNAGTKDFIYFFGVWVLANPLFGVIRRFFNINIGIDVQFVTGFFGYFILGYFLHKNDVTPAIRKAIYALSLLSLVLTIIGTFALTANNNGRTDEYFYTYLSPNVLIMSTGVFLLFKNIRWEKVFRNRGPLLKLLSVISSTSFGIYLMHPLVLEALSNKGISFRLVHPIIGVPVTVFITVIICFITIWIVKRIPYIRHFTP